MAVYWLSFRIHDDAGYEAAYKSLITAVEKAVQGKWWYDTTSFYVFSSDLAIGELSSRLKEAIRPDLDLVVLGMPEYMDGRVIGANHDADIFELISFMEKA